MPGKLDAVGFIIKSMVERDPSKRRVKPSQQALAEFEGLALEDSSDDSDYKVDEKDEDEDGDSNFSGDDDDDNDDGKDNEGSGSEDSSDEADVEEEEADVTVSELLSRAAQDVPGGDKAAVKRIKVCSVCLGDRSSDQNELVECDSCHVTVHEGCNGISESHSAGSTASSDVTEPWFCDACRAGATRFECDLCPNTGGLMKETDTGRWVHLVCALYVPGVAFGDVDRLTAVTLFEIPYTRWGGKVCMVCEDTSLARTGVTIQCDAGMCKAAFHVTCAQRNGLLQEPRIDEEAADPYFAHCKLHTDKTQIRDRKRNYLALRLYQRQEHPQKMEPAKLQRKLGRLQHKYRQLMQTRKPKWTPSMKLPRAISSSPYLLRCLQRRAALMGVDLDQGHHPAAQVTDVSKKWHLPPAFSMEFVSYFLDRSHRMASMSRSLKELMAEKATLQREENGLRSSYAEMEGSLAGLRQSGEQLRAAGLQLHRQLAALSGDKLKLPAVLQPPRVRKTSTGRTTHRLSPTKLASPGAGGRLTLHECVECGASSEQHLLALCDTCHNHYHLACLDPPLTRMPRKSKTAGWECWRCAAAGSRAQSPQTLPDAPRGGRRTRQAGAAVNMQPRVKLEAPLQRTVFSPARRAASALSKKTRSVYVRKDIKFPGVGRGNAPRSKRRSEAADFATDGVPGIKTTARLGVRDSVTVDDRRISQIVTQSEAACSSVVVIEKLDDALVHPHEPSPSPAPKRRRRPTADSLAATPAAPAAATASAAAPAGDTSAAAAGAAAAGAGGARTPLTVTAPSAGSSSGDRPPPLSPARSRRYRSIDETIDDILEQVAADPSGGPPTPPPFVYEGRGRPPLLEPLKTWTRRGRPSKSPAVKETPAMAAPAEAMAEAPAEAMAETPAEAPAETPADTPAEAPAETPAAEAASVPRRGRPPGSGRGGRRGGAGARPPGRPARATPGRPRGRPPVRLIAEPIPEPAPRAPGRPRGGGPRTPGRPRRGGGRAPGRQRGNRAEMAALNEFLARRRAERRSQSEASPAENGAAEAAPPPPPPQQDGGHPEPPPLAAEIGSEPGPAAPAAAEVHTVPAVSLPRLVPGKRSGLPRKPGPKERAKLKAAHMRSGRTVKARAEVEDKVEAGADVEMEEKVEAEVEKAGVEVEEKTGPPSAAAAGPSSLGKARRRRRRTKAEMQAARLLSTAADGVAGPSVPSVPSGSPDAAEGPGAVPDEPSAATAASSSPGLSPSGRPARERRTKAEMQLYREQVLALKQARERHQQQRQKLFNKRRRQEQGREHVVEVMTDMKIKIRPVASEAAPSTAAGQGDGNRAGSSLEGGAPELPAAAQAAAGAPAAPLCSNCELATAAANTVRCDDCGRCYHFRCLVPPVNKTPKRLGYGWLCGNCSGRPPPPTAAAASDPVPTADPAPAATPTSAADPTADPTSAAAPTAEQEPGRAAVDPEPEPEPTPPPPPPAPEQQQRSQSADADPAPLAAEPAPSQ